MGNLSRAHVVAIPSHDLTLCLISASLLPPKLKVGAYKYHFLFIILYLWFQLSGSNLQKYAHADTVHSKSLELCGSTRFLHLNSSLESGDLLDLDFFSHH